jgi:cobalt-zinc-cadmium resistance protein CzcA
MSIEQMNQYLSMAFSGEKAGDVYEQERRFDLVVRFNEDSVRISTISATCM